VVTGGPRLGDAFVGLSALLALWAPPLLGGLALVGVVLALIARVPAFHRYDATAVTPTSL